MRRFTKRNTSSNITLSAADCSTSFFFTEKKNNVKREEGGGPFEKSISCSARYPTPQHLGLMTQEWRNYYYRLHSVPSTSPEISHQHAPSISAGQEIPLKNCRHFRSHFHLLHIERKTRTSTARGGSLKTGRASNRL